MSLLSNCIQTRRIKLKSISHVIQKIHFYLKPQFRSNNVRLKKAINTYEFSISGELEDNWVPNSMELLNSILSLNWEVISTPVCASTPTMLVYLSFLVIVSTIVSDVTSRSIWAIFSILRWCFSLHLIFVFCKALFRKKNKTGKRGNGNLA